MNQPFTYSQIKDLQSWYKQNQPGSILADADTATFSNLMQLTDQSGQDFSMGRNPSWVKDYSAAVTRGMESSGLAGIGGDVGATFGSGID